MSQQRRGNKAFENPAAGSPIRPQNLPFSVQSQRKRIIFLLSASEVGRVSSLCIPFPAILPFLWSNCLLLFLGVPFSRLFWYTIYLFPVCGRVWRSFILGEARWKPPTPSCFFPILFCPSDFPLLFLVGENLCFPLISLFSVYFYFRPFPRKRYVDFFYIYLIFFHSNSFVSLATFLSLFPGFCVGWS